MTQKEKLVIRLKNELGIDVDASDIIDVHHGPIDRGATGLSWTTLRRRPEVGSTISATRLNRAERIYLHRNDFRIEIDILPPYAVAHPDNCQIWMCAKGHKSNSDS